MTDLDHPQTGSQTSPAPVVRLKDVSLVYGKTRRS